jgi:hypothetical protein
MNRQRWIKPLLIALLLCCTTPLSAAETEPAAEPVPWHVKDAELRVPVKVKMKDALLRMPPQVYVADLKPLAVTGGLAFNPQTKSAIQRDVRKPAEKAATIAKQKELYKKAGKKWDPKAYGRLHETHEGGPIMRITGSATYAIRPEYKYFSWRPNDARVYIDGKLVPEESLLQVTWKPGEDRRNAKECRLARLAPIPSGAKTLKIETPARYLRQAGFIIRSPGVARATICLPGRDPSKLVPVVHRASGERVGCRTVWAEAGKPMPILFDSSSGDEEYWVYFVDQAKKPTPLDWIPRAGLVEEVRQLDRYDPDLETLAGFEKLWDASATIVGRGVPRVRPRRMGPAQPARVIYRGSVQFRSKAADGLNLAELGLSQPASLSRISGTFQISGTGSYRIFCMAGPGGYVLLDGQLIATFRGAKSGRLFEIEIDKGQHRLEILQYGPTGQVGWAGLWWKDLEKQPDGNYHPRWPKFGDAITYLHAPYQSNMSPYMLWEPMADATTAPLESRAPASWASFTWYQHAHLWAVSPGHDLTWVRFSAHAPGASTGAVYRWRFDDGRTAEGKQIMKLFLQPGMRKVQLEVLDAPGGKVIAHAVGEVNAQLELADWNNFSIKHDNRDRRSHLVRMIWAFAEEDRLEQLPLDDLVNLYEWSFPLKHWQASRRLLYGDGIPNFAPAPLALREVIDRARRRIGDMLPRRVDELIAAYPYSQLLQIAQSLSRTENGPTGARYAAAEKLLAVVLDRSPAGSSHWRTAALALSDIRLSVRGEAEFAAALLKKFAETEPAVDMNERWQFAKARQYHHLADTDKLAALTAGLDWSPITRPRHWDYHKGTRIYFENGRGFWLTQAFDLPSNWKGKRLMFNAGGPRGGHVWINGEPLGRMWQWQDRNIVIPAKLLKKVARIASPGCCSPIHGRSRRYRRLPSYPPT